MQPSYSRTCLVIRELYLESFKCFREESIQLGRLTVLAGGNSAGKSSIVQALVLLSDLAMSKPGERVVKLNRRGMALGSAMDVLNYRSSRQECVLGFSDDDTSLRFLFKAKSRESLSLAVQQLDINSPKAIRKSRAKGAFQIVWDLPMMDTLRRLKWISSERVGPRDISPLVDSAEASSVGFDGSSAASLLYWHEGRAIPESIVLSEHPNTLFNQVRGRMRGLFPESDFKVARIDTAVGVSIGFRTSTSSEFRRPQNVGFGMTQVFPIVVELLAATPGDTVIIENPEIHLHPRAQQELAILMSRVAGSGVQIVVETHSDHILNGFRIAVKRGILPSDKLRMNFLASNKDGIVSRESPSVDKDGRLDCWPDGFFDQYGVSLSELL